MTLFAVPPALALSIWAMASFPGYAAPKSDDPLAIYRDKARVLVVVAPSQDDERLGRQREFFAAMKRGAAERDLALVEAIGETPEARQLRRAFNLSEGFQVVLVGKDGGSKLVTREPLGPEKLFPVIDAMPMRQREMRAR